MRRQRRGHVDHAAAWDAAGSAGAPADAACAPRPPERPASDRPARLVLRAMAVFRIADDRMADRFGMGAQLMRAAGDRPHRQPGETRRDLVDDGVIGQRMLRVGLAMAGDAHFFEVATSRRRACAARARRPCPRPWRETAKCAPAPVSGRPRPAPSRFFAPAASERPRRARRRSRRFLATQQHARRVAVEPMHQHRPAVALGQRRQHSVDMPASCPSRPARRGRKAC